MVEKYDISLSGGIKSAKLKRSKKRIDGDTWMYLGLVGQIGYTIAIPLVVGVLGGVFIDKELGTRPVVTLIGLALGAVVSVIGFTRTLKEVLQKNTKK